MASSRIPLAEPDTSGNEARYLEDCIRTNSISSIGPFVHRFETMVADSCGAQAGAAMASGTAALHVALASAGVGRDDLVVLPSFTFVASANAVAHCGATPWLVDVDRASWTLDVAGLEELLDREAVVRGPALRERRTGRRVAAILPVYTLGVPADLDPLRDLAARRRLPLVADAAAALGATYRGRPLGGLADLTIFSFNGNKTVTSGGGGMVVGPEEEPIARLRHLSQQARTGAGYDHDAVGYNYRMTNLQAAVGCAQMERLEELVAAKRAIRDRYDRAFADDPVVEPFPRPGWAEGSCWFSGVVLRRRSGLSVSAICAEMGDLGIEVRPFWKPVHRQRPFLGAPRASLEVTEDLWDRIVTLPCSTRLTTTDQDRVVEGLRKVLSRRGSAS